MELQEVHKSVKNSKWMSLLSGFIGATLPSLAVLYAMTQVSAEQFELPHFNFFLGMFIMGGLGSFIVVISNERNTYKAFPLGGGAPSLLNTAGTVAAVQGGETATSFLEHIGAVFVSVAMMVTPSVQAQPDTTIQEKIVDSINVVVKVDVDQFINMVIGMESYSLRDSVQFKIPKVDSVYIGDLESYKKYAIPQKELIYIQILLIDEKKSKSKRHFMKGFFAMQQQISKRMESKKFKVVIE